MEECGVEDHRVTGHDIETPAETGEPRQLGRSADPARVLPSWVWLGAAAAVVVLLAGGLVITFSGSDGDTMTPVDEAPQPEVVSAPPVPETAVESELTTVTDTAPGPTEPPAPVIRQTIVVDASNPPPLVEPVVLASVPLEPDPSGSGVSVAIGPDNIVVKQPTSDFVSLIGPPDVTVRQVPVPVELNSIVSGPGPVVYGLGGPVFDADDQTVPRGLRFLAIPFLGDRAGDIVAETEVALNDYLELPDSFFGHGPNGVIDRGRQVGRTVIDYVDETGAPLDPSDEFPLPAFEDTDGDGIRESRDVIELVGSERSWQLDIRRDPAHAGTYVGPSPPAPTTGGRVVYFERIGADLTPEQDFGPNAMPVVAILNPDGSGTWVRLPDDWGVVASDVWGTVLMRRTGTELEFALLDDALDAAGQAPTPPPPTAVPTAPVDDADALAIDRNCASEFDCTQLANTEDGRIVAYDPADETLRVYDATGRELNAEVSIASSVTPLDQAWLVDVGPDDVAYLAASTEASVESQLDLLAIPLVGDRAGEVVVVWTGVDGTGDSTLVPRRAGLTVVPCCGDRLPRPARDAPIYSWADRNGDAIESTAPSFDLTLGDAGSSLTRIDGEATFTRFTLPTVFQNPRDFPTTVATDDGGALSSDFVQTRAGGVTVLVDFDTDWPEFGIDNGDVYYRRIGDSIGVALLEPSGTVVVGTGDGFVRRSIDEIATPGWPGTARVDADSGVVTAPGVNDHIDEHQPFWADDPELFAYQIKSSIGPNERVSIEYDGSAAPVIDIVTEGFLDDSVAASRLRITTERGADGLLRFVDGFSTFRCQPGRGHQDFSRELCT